ncbi:MAG: hypothetical protein JJE04_00485 [Acidobacteriia bacterium]|nr:hypothetical protein [Terriglobia bacterium]
MNNTALAENIAQAKPAVKSNRLGYLDWTRGIGAAIMLQGHVFHAFTNKDLRQDSPYILSQFIGGMPPAIFLFLTGITLAFLMDSSERKGLSTRNRITTGLSRAAYLFALAFAFRVQLFIFALPSSFDRWSDLLRVDILNCMGFAIAAVSIMSVFSTADRIRHCAILGLGIAVASPIISSLDWSGVPPLVRMYIVPDYNFFSFFPWGSFLAFGVSAGSIIRVARGEHVERLMQWGALAGFGLIVGGQYFSDLPYSLYSKSDFWLNSPGLTLIKLGVILLMLSFAYVWHTYVVKENWSWVCQIGTTSLLVYWVHTELVYGRWFWMWKENLSVPQTVACTIVVFLLMIGLSTIKSRWNQVRDSIPFLQRRLQPEPE